MNRTNYNRNNTGRDIEAAQDTVIPGVAANPRAAKSQRKGGSSSQSRTENEDVLDTLMEKRNRKIF